MHEGLQRGTDLAYQIGDPCISDPFLIISWTIYQISLVHINLEVRDEKGGVTKAYVNRSTISTKNDHQVLDVMPVSVLLFISDNKEFNCSFASLVDQLMLNMSSNTMKSGGCSFTGADSNHSDLDASAIRKVESSKMAEPKKATKSGKYMKTSTTTTTHQPRH